MPKPNENFLTAIDVGSAKTCVLVSEITDTGLRYRGHGLADSRGSRKGIIVDLEKAVASIQKAVERAEDSANVPIEHAILGVAGSHVRGINTHGGLILIAPGKLAVTRFGKQSTRPGPSHCLLIAKCCICCRKNSFSMSSMVYMIRSA